MTTSAQEEQRLRKSLAGSTGSFTYHSRAEADLQLENQGRHAKGATVTGSARVPLYPAASGPWNDPVQVPDEPPLGYSVEDLEVTGTPSEVEDSLTKASPSVASLPPDGDVATASAIPSLGAKEASAVSTSAADASTFIRRGRKL